MVATITLAALLDARPNGPFWGRAWVEQVLSRHLPGYGTESTDQRLCAWSVGAVLGNETLMQSRPILRDRETDPVDDLLRTSAGCTIAVFATRPSSEVSSDAASTVRLGRYRRWVGVRSAEALTREQRDAVRAELPDFLARAAGQSDTELVFLRYLAALREHGGLAKTYAPREVIRSALRVLGERLPDGPLNLLVSDGRTLGILHRGGTLLAFEPPADLQPRRRWRVEGGEQNAPAKLFLWKDGPPPDAPIGGAERIAEGVLTAPAARPSLLERN